MNAESGRSNKSVYRPKKLSLNFGNFEEKREKLRCFEINLSEKRPF